MGSIQGEYGAVGKVKSILPQPKARCEAALKLLHSFFSSLLVAALPFEVYRLLGPLVLCKCGPLTSALAKLGPSHCGLQGQTQALQWAVDPTPAPKVLRCLGGPINLHLEEELGNSED